jgi:hypothetical protein
MKLALAFAVVLAFGAGSSLANTKYCADPATHKRVACPVAAASALHAPPAAAPTSKLVMPAVMRPPKG